jgi:hypothetical protein
LNIIDGKKTLFGICSKQALSSKDIYRHPSSFFHLVGNELYYIANRIFEDDEESYLVDASHIEMEANLVIMHVDLVNWRIWWHQGRRQSEKFPIPSECRGCELHPVILV